MGEAWWWTAGPADPTVEPTSYPYWGLVRQSWRVSPSRGFNHAHMLCTVWSAACRKARHGARGRQAGGARHEALWWCVERQRDRPPCATMRSACKDTHHYIRTEETEGGVGWWNHLHENHLQDQYFNLNTLPVVHEIFKNIFLCVRGAEACPHHLHFHDHRRTWLGTQNIWIPNFTCRFRCQ